MKKDSFNVFCILRITFSVMTFISTFVTAPKSTINDLTCWQFPSFLLDSFQIQKCEKQKMIFHTQNSEKPLQCLYVITVALLSSAN